MHHNYHFSRKSKNIKTGPIPTVTISKDSCPDTCPLKDNGCYGDNYFQGMHWRKVTARERGGSLNKLCQNIRDLPEGQLWRYAVSGDLPHYRGKLFVLDVDAIVQANIGRKGFTYTHHTVAMFHNYKVIKLTNQEGFTINLSSNSPDHADYLADLDIAPVVTLLPIGQVLNSVTPAGRDVVVCPAMYKDKVSCATCKLCQVRDNRPIIGFPAHSTKSKAVQEVAKTF